MFVRACVFYCFKLCLHVWFILSSFLNVSVIREWSPPYCFHILICSDQYLISIFIHLLRRLFFPLLSRPWPLFGDRSVMCLWVFGGVSVVFHWAMCLSFSPLPYCLDYQKPYSQCWNQLGWDLCLFSKLLPLFKVLCVSAYPASFAGTFTGNTLNA